MYLTNSGLLLRLGVHSGSKHYVGGGCVTFLIQDCTRANLDRKLKNMHLLFFFSRWVLHVIKRVAKASNFEGDGISSLYAAYGKTVYTNFR